MQESNFKDLEETLKARFESTSLPEGRNLFPEISERVKKNKESSFKVKFFVAAAITAFLIAVSVLFIDKISQPQDSIAGNTVNSNNRFTLISKEPENEKANAPVKGFTNTQDTVSKVSKSKSRVKKAVPGFSKVIASGENKNEILPDSSYVLLKNGASLSIASDFGKPSRNVSLSGTAYFDVKSDSNSFFRIETEKALVTVLGTSFNLSSSSDKEEIFVSSGVVRYKSKSTGKSVKLLKGMYAFMSNENIQIVENASENHLAWKTGKLVFQNIELNVVFETLENYYNKEIIVKDENILKCSFSGNFLNSDLSEVMEVLSLSLKFDWKEQGDKIMISGKGCN